MRTRAIAATATGALLFACASFATASPWGAAIAVGTGAGEDFRYVQLKIFDGQSLAWNQPTGIFNAFNYDSTANPAFSQYYNDGQILGVHLPDGAPAGGTYAHFIYGAFQVVGPDPTGQTFHFHAQLYDVNRNQLHNWDVSAFADSVDGNNHINFTNWQVTGGTWTQATVIPLPTAGLMGLAGLGLMGAYRRRRA